MTVGEIIVALIGVDGNIEIEIVDEDGIAAELTEIKFTPSLGRIYGEGLIDRKMIADDETAVKS